MVMTVDRKAVEDGAFLAMEAAAEAYLSSVDPEWQRKPAVFRRNAVRLAARVAYVSLTRQAESELNDYEATVWGAEPCKS